MKNAYSRRLTQTELVRRGGVPAVPYLVHGHAYAAFGFCRMLNDNRPSLAGGGADLFHLVNHNVSSFASKLVVALRDPTFRPMPLIS